MLCAELERLEAEFDDIVDALEDLTLPEWRRKELESAYVQVAREIRAHQSAGHRGEPCFEPNETATD